jgi:hypothetical protein
MVEEKFTSYRDGSRTNWGQHSQDGKLCIDQIRLGAQLRTADSLEGIAISLREFRWLSVKDYDELLKLRKDNMRLKRMVKKSQGTKS